MSPEQTLALLRVVAVAHDREIPDGLASVWHATLGGLPYGDARQAVIELLQTSPYLPKPAEIHERARLIAGHREREAAKRDQVAGRRAAIESAVVAREAGQRTGANMVRHVLDRLKAAGQDTWNGQFLGVDRASVIAEAACAEWLDKTDPQQRLDTDGAPPVPRRDT